VDGQPEIGRIDHQVVAAGLDARRLHVFSQQVGQLRDLGIGIPADPGQVLPAPAGGWGDRPHRVELAAVGSAAIDVQRP